MLYLAFKSERAFWVWLQRCCPRSFEQLCKAASPHMHSAVGRQQACCPDLLLKEKRSKRNIHSNQQRLSQMQLC